MSSASSEVDQLAGSEKKKRQMNKLVLRIIAVSVLYSFFYILGNLKRKSEALLIVSILIKDEI